MKKITSFLTLMVLCCVSAFAQAGMTPVTSLEQLTDETIYTIASARCALIYNPAQAEKLNTTNATGLNVMIDPMDTNQHFNIKKNEGKYYLYSIGAKKYVKHSGEQSVYVETIAEASELGISETGNSQYPWLLKLAGNGINTQVKGQYQTGMVINSWVTVDEGNSFAITAIDLSSIDPYEFAFNRLTDAMTSVGQALNIADLKAGKNVGAFYGNYKPEIVEYFLAKQDSASNIVDAVQGAGLDPLKTMFTEPKDMDAFTARYVEAKDSVVENTVPREIPDIAPGYYTISSGLTFTKVDTVYVYYTEEEAEEENMLNGAEPGSPDYIEAGVTVKERIPKTVAQDPKALYEYNGKAYWGTRKETADFLWKVEKGDTAKAYKIINMNQKMTFARINQSQGVNMEKNDTSEYFITWWGLDTLADNRIVDLIAIRNIVDGPASYRHIHCNNHSNGTGTNGNIVGWAPGASASQWFLTPVSDEEAAEWMDSMKPILELRAKIKEGDSIAAAFPAQLKIAQDSISNPAAQVAADGTYFYSPYSTNDGQTVPSGKSVYDFLLDDNANTYWHSSWSGGNVDANVHYLQINSPAEIQGEFLLRYVRRKAGADQIKVFTIKGYTTEPTSATTFNDGTEIAVVTYEEPYATNGDTLITGPYDLTGYKYIRLYPTETTSNRGYWHAAELNFISPDPTIPTKITRYATTQYSVRQAKADALKAAVDLWNEKAFADDSVALLTDQTFIDAYNNIVATGKAWGEVYVDPTELRSTIEAHNYDAKMFPIGKNPGEWSDDSKVSVIGVVNDAKAYNESGAYNKVTSANWIKAINNADSVTLASANGVKTGVWYQFAFPSEAMFDEFGWDKAAGAKTIKAAADTHTGEDIVRCEGIFGKIVAAGESVTEYFYNKGELTDTVTIYKVGDADQDFYAGQNMFFYTEDEIENFELGENLFRFIEATDSSYMIQNKATGLFLRGGHPCTLSPIPTYWSTKALGAGGNLVTYTDVLGNTVSNLRHLHGQNSDRRLVCWEADQIGSRSMMLIEEVEDVTEEPETEYQLEMWPGTIYAMTMPVDITIVEESGYDTPTAYGASLKVTETDTTLVLNPIEDKTIKAGHPFLLLVEPTWIAEDSTEYESIDEATERYKQEIDPKYVPGSENEEETWKYWNNNALNGKLTLGYYVALMDHGMDVKTEARWIGSLRGTMEADTISAGKGFVAVDNKFEIVKETADIEAFSAYIDANFTAETEGGLIIDLKGEPIIDTGIADVLNKVAKTGNIYNAAGQLVGKGNLNTVNKLPAGVYIVNGVKVTKR